VPEKPLEMHRDQPGQDASNSTNRPPFHEMQPGRRGGSAGTIRGDRAVAPVAADNCEPGDLLSVPGIMPNLGALPAASTEVVLAEGCYSALPPVVRIRDRRPGARNDGALVPVIGRQPARVFLSSLIPVLVTGIQRGQVLGHTRLISHWHGFIHGAEAPWLDSCDRHRNEGSRGGRAHSQRAVSS